MNEPRCIGCAHFSLRDSALARHGFGTCSLGDSWRYLSALLATSCGKFRAAMPERAAARVEWLRKNAGGKS